jgi:hypothetical protein
MKLFGIGRELTDEERENKYKRDRWKQQLKCDKQTDRIQHRKQRLEMRELHLREQEVQEREREMRERHMPVATGPRTRIPR